MPMLARLSGCVINAKREGEIMQWSLVALQAKLEVSNPTLAHLVLL